MTRIMIFIDGTWLYRNRPRLAKKYGAKDYRLDYGKLPEVLSKRVAEQLHLSELDVVRTHLFGSIPWNFAPDDEDEEKVRRQQNF